MGAMFEVFGTVLQYALPVGVGLKALHKGFVREGVGLGVAAAIQQVALRVIKKTTCVARPFPNQIKLDSFPSGHTAGAFLSIGFILGLELFTDCESTTTEKVCFVALAVLVGVSRVALRMHWTTDVLGGAALGLFFGGVGPFLVSLLSKNRET